MQEVTTEVYCKAIVAHLREKRSSGVRNVPPWSVVEEVIRQVHPNSKGIHYSTRIQMGSAVLRAINLLRKEHTLLVDRVSGLRLSNSV